MDLVKDKEPTEADKLHEKLKAARVKGWTEFKQALLMDIPAGLPPFQIQNILKSHENAFDMGCMATLEGFQDVSKETQILS